MMTTQSEASKTRDLIRAADAVVAWFDRDHEFVEQVADYVVESGHTSESFQKELLEDLRSAIANARK